MRAILTGVFAAALLAGPAIAAEPSVDVTPDHVTNIARGFGSALLHKTQNGQPVVLGRIEEQNYVIFLIDCQDRPSCALIQFSAEFPAENAKLEKINAWNREKRFGRVSIGPNQKIWVSQAVITGEGIPIKSLERYFGFWKLVLKEVPPFVTSD